jgi:GNAT superfamily N-acetyltransferase
VPQLVIRPATIVDAPLIATLVREHAAYEGGPRVGGTDADFAAGLADGAFECLIAEAAGEPIGLLLFYPIFSSWSGRRGLFLEDLFVRESARGLGFGRRLVAELARLALRRGGSRIDLVVTEHNVARRFYEQLGLRQVDGWLLYRAEAAALQALAAAPSFSDPVCE